MSSQILTTIPTSGEFTEKHFGEHFNSQIWVKFINTNLDEWVGCFSKSSERGLCLAITNEDNSKSFVVAGGKGYLIDINERTLITELDDQVFIESAIKTINPDYFIAGAIHSIYILNNSGLLKEIRPEYIIDGIYFRDQLENKAIGELATAENQYQRNVDFEFDLITFDLTLNYKRKQGLLRKILNRFTS